MKRQRLMLLFLIVFCLLLWAIPALAQDSSNSSQPVVETSEPTSESTIAAVTDVAPVVQPGGVVVVNPAPAPAPATSGIDWQTIFMLFLACIIAIDRITGQGLQKLLAGLIDPGKAQILYESGVRFGLQMALNRAARTSDPSDDAEWKRQALDAGYTANLQPDGTYSLVKTASVGFPTLASPPAGTGPA